jgi:hypothetical protein
LSDVGYIGHTLHFKPDSHFLIEHNEILLNVIKTMLLAADRSITLTVDNLSDIKFQYQKKHCHISNRILIWNVTVGVSIKKILKKLQSQLMYIYGYVY